MIKQILLAVALGACLSVRAQSSFSLQRALDYGVEHSLDLQSKQLDVELQLQKNREITASAYPQINGSSGFQYNYKKQVVLFPDFVTPQIYGALITEGLVDPTTIDPNLIDPNRLSPVSFVQNYGLTGTAQLQQLLFEPSVFVGLKARDASIQLAENQKEKSVLEIKENIYKSYYGVLIAKVNQELINSNMNLVQSLKENTAAIYKAGFAEKLDVDKLEVQLNNLKNEKVKAENFLEVTRYQLKYAMNFPIQDSLSLTDSLDASFIQDLQVLLEEPITSSSTIDYKILKSNQELAELNVMRYKYQRYPTLSFFANYGFNSPTNDFNYFSSDANYYGQGMLGLNLSIPLYTGGRIKSQILQAELQSQQIDIAVRNLDRAYNLQDKTLKTNLRNALIALETQEKNIELARKVYETTKIKYETGVGSSIEVIQANTEYQNAQTNYYQSLYEALLAKINILKALNQL